MPKVAKSLTLKLHSYVKEFGDKVFSTDGRVLLCKICEREVTAERRSQVTQYISGGKHKLLLDKKDPNSSSVVQMSPFLEASGKQSQFSLDMCDAFLSAGIPLEKLENAKLRSFLEKYCRQQLPSSSTIRKNHIKSVYEQKLDFIRSYLADKAIWVSIDETTDATGRFVAHVVVGTLESVESRSFLLHAESLERTNSSTIAQVFSNSLSLLWPNGIQHDKVLLLVTDGAAYMTKAGSALKVLFPKMLHVTCAAHAVHRIAEEIRHMFPDVDKLVANGKKIFLKSAARISVFREISPGTALPPQPALTRWGTWINAAIYYSRNFAAFSSVVDALDANEAASIRIVQELLKKTSLNEDLAFIEVHFGGLPKTIAILEKKGAPLVESTSVFGSLLLDLQKVPGVVGEHVRRKCKMVLSRNPVHDLLKTVADILCGSPSLEAADRFSPSELASLKYAPITSVDVERTFSILKHFLSQGFSNFSGGGTTRHLQHGMP